MNKECRKNLYITELTEQELKEVTSCVGVAAYRLGESISRNPDAVDVASAKDRYLFLRDLEEKLSALLKSGPSKPV